MKENELRQNVKMFPFCFLAERLRPKISSHFLGFHIEISYQVKKSH